VQHIALWAEPIDSDKARDMWWKTFHRHQTAPRHTAGEFGPIGAEKALAHFRVNAIGSDCERCARDAAGVEPDLHLFVGLSDGDAPPAELDRVWPQSSNRIDENAM
jgi:hypothetical protein